MSYLVFTSNAWTFNSCCAGGWYHLLKHGFYLKKINIAKIRMNSHELHSQIGHWTVPKTPWVERICHLCENRNIEDENHFLLDCPAYTHIRSQFHNLCCNTDLPSLLTCQNYSELVLLTKLFEHRNTILKQTNLFIYLGPIDQSLISGTLTIMIIIKFK